MSWKGKKKRRRKTRNKKRERERAREREREREGGGGGRGRREDRGRRLDHRDDPSASTADRLAGFNSIDFTRMRSRAALAIPPFGIR